MKSLKAQAAMEFLTTYGWALIILAVAIAAIVYSGLLNPRQIETFSLPAGFLCESVVLKESGPLQPLLLRQNTGEDIIITHVACSREQLTDIDITKKCGSGGIILKLDSAVSDNAGLYVANGATVEIKANYLGSCYDGVNNHDRPHCFKNVNSDGSYTASSTKRATGKQGEWFSGYVYIRYVTANDGVPHIISGPVNLPFQSLAAG